MAHRPKILAFNGSPRAESWNFKLVRAAGGGAERTGAEVTYLHLKDLPMPVFSEDLEAEQGMDKNARRFKELLMEHDGWLIASPENNSSLSAVLKNAIDWASRKEEGETPLQAFKGKTAAIMSASPGGLGGLRGLVHLRAILGNIQVLVLPQQQAVSRAHEQFDDRGELKDAALRGKIEALGAELVEFCARHYG